jgi:hypothetical protein
MARDVSALHRAQTSSEAQQPPMQQVAVMRLYSLLLLIPYVLIAKLKLNSMV